MKKRLLAAKQMDRQLKLWQQVKRLLSPRHGWIRTIRKTLDMNTDQLAERLCVDRSRVTRIEADEIRGALTLKTMVSVANALDCDFVYALVPKKSLQNTIEQQAYNAAEFQINNASHNMLLEDQSLSVKKNKEQIEELKLEFLEGSSRKLWSNK